MSLPHRIAAGGIVVKNDAILLVRYADPDGTTYLVGPGGGLEEGENAFQAVVREVREETGVTVQPRKVLFIEDILCSQSKMCKIWILCNASDDPIQVTEGARVEGILESAWFRRHELDGAVVYPSPILSCDWRAFLADDWQVQCLPQAQARF